MFSVSSWELFCDRVSPLERQGTQVAAPAPPFFVFRFPRLRARCALLDALHFLSVRRVSDGVLWTAPSQVPEGGR